MGYHRPGSQDLYAVIDRTLKDKAAFGHSKFADKKNGEDVNYIYSESTLSTYRRHAREFAQYVAKASHDGRSTSFDDAKKYGRDWLQSEINSGKSAWTIKMERSILAKLYGTHGPETVQAFGNTPSRHRADIKRGRQHYVTSPTTGKIIKNQKSRFGRFSEKKHEDLVTFASGTGLRKDEIAHVRGNQLHQRADGTYFFSLDGRYCKGGKPRDVTIIGDIDKIVAMAQSAGKEKIFAKLPYYEEHYYRSIYACNLYQSLARSKEECAHSTFYNPLHFNGKGQPAGAVERAIFYCRCDKKGSWFDKKAMLVVSLNLGHSRINVIANNYLWNLNK